MKIINKYIIAFLANGLFIVQTFASEATNQAVDVNADNTNLINFLINNQAEAEAMIADDGEGGSSDSPGFDPNEDPDVPIDGGISILVGAGFAYGAARLRKKKEVDLK
jgi:hypothetical protein